MRVSSELTDAINHIEGQYRAADVRSEELSDTIPAIPDTRKFAFYEANGELYYRDDSDYMTRFKAKWGY